MKDAPSKIYDSKGHIPFGVYDGLIQDTSTALWDNKGGLFKVRRTKRKAWIFFGVYSAELICIMAVADAGFFANSFCYYYLPADNIFEEDSVMVPLGFPAAFDAQLNSDWNIGNYKIYTGDNNKMHFEYNGKFHLQIEAELNLTGASIMAPSHGTRPFNFTYKNVCLPVEARIEKDGKLYKATGDLGAIDFTKGYPPRKTVWDWCSFCGKTESGKSIGLNLVKHFNGEIENIVWIDGKKVTLGQSYFKLTKPLNKEPWLMGTEDKQLTFKLTPYGVRGANINLIVLRSYFVQAFGKMEGELKIGESIERFIAYGVTEDHLALW